MAGNAVAIQQRTFGGSVDWLLGRQASG